MSNRLTKEVTETPRTDAMSQEIELQDATYHNAYERARGLCYELELALAEALAWTDEDKPLPEDEAIEAAHPLKTKDFRTHAEAMRLVGAKRSKGALVDLVNWLLRSISETSNRWIPVSERLPKQHQTVLIVDLFGECCSGFLGADGRTGAWFWHGFDGRKEAPTHWMPLPEAPK